MSHFLTCTWFSVIVFAQCFCFEEQRLNPHEEVSTINKSYLAAYVAVLTMSMFVCWISCEVQVEKFLVLALFAQIRKAVWSAVHMRGSSVNVEMSSFGCQLLYFYCSVVCKFRRRYDFNGSSRCVEVQGFRITVRQWTRLKIIRWWCMHPVQ